MGHRYKCITTRHPVRVGFGRGTAIDGGGETTRIDAGGCSGHDGGRWW